MITPETVIEVHSDYTDNDNLTHIDCYSSNEAEQGKVAAVVCRDTGKVIFMDNSFRNCGIVRDEINRVLLEVRTGRREKALTWWRKLPESIKHPIYKEYKEKVRNDTLASMQSLTGREIEKIYESLIRI